MHPNPSYRHNDRDLHEALIDEVGFGMIFAQTPEGPRVAHTPIISTGNGTVQFHLARSNAVAKHLEGSTALVTINGPEAYISPRWYQDRGTVPTWNYVALELEGPVRILPHGGLEHLLTEIAERGEGRIERGEPWTSADTPQGVWDKLIGAIHGFEMEVADTRPTFKLSQNQVQGSREQVIEALETQGSAELAALMREFSK